MKRVDIYTAVDSASTRKYEKNYAYMLVCEAGGRIGHIEGIGMAAGTQHKVELTAMAEALERMNQSCEIHLHSRDKWILDMIDRNLDKWAGNGYINAKGRPVGNREEWMRLRGLMQKHLIVTERDTYEFYIRDGEKMAGHPVKTESGGDFEGKRSM